MLEERKSIKKKQSVPEVDLFTKLSEVTALGKSNSSEITSSTYKVNTQHGIDEVQALRNVFFKFFNIQTKELNESKRKTDSVKQDPYHFTANPFYDKSIVALDDSYEQLERRRMFGSAAKTLNKNESAFF
jgi:hypothetical protein